LTWPARRGSSRGQIAQGKPWQAICEAAEELDVSMIVLGARGLSRIPSALLGGVSAAVLVNAERPVLVVPRRQRSS
jgi:nucleotide-binding universal stress UspA family protein